MSVRSWVPIVAIVALGVAVVMFGLFSMTHHRDGPREVAATNHQTNQQAAAFASSNSDPSDPELDRRRERMINRDLAGRDITDLEVLGAMGRVRREEFVPIEHRAAAYDDHPLPIGHGQTISQPYIVALMTQLARPTADARALDVGTGSGYQAAILAELCKEVYSIEIVEPLAEQARRRLERLGYKNITARHGDGYRGWPEHAPFDVIIVAAAPDHVPEPLIDQLAPGGRLVIPVGRFFQQLLLIEKQPDGTVHSKIVTGVAFVPMTGEAEKTKPE